MRRSSLHLSLSRSFSRSFSLSLSLSLSLYLSSCLCDWVSISQLFLKILSFLEVSLNCDEEQWVSQIATKGKHFNHPDRLLGFGLYSSGGISAWVTEMSACVQPCLLVQHICYVCSMWMLRPHQWVCFWRGGGETTTQHWYPWQLWGWRCLPELPGWLDVYFFYYNKLICSAMKVHSHRLRHEILWVIWQ